MKLAIAKNNELVHEFFGSCNDFMLVEIVDGEVKSKEVIFNDTETHKLRPAYLKSLGVNALVIKGLGLTAYDLLHENGIEVYSSEPILLDDALDLYLKNELKRMEVPGGAHC
ncbi:MAG TPA: NifB/NifX family molybdenum-iron cluster-binding protein [Erysipelotrichaceae bacterium]|nr:NifB/NifX family molybdenum-iron cluster-binding protein [Erysipelotrichaceae bacterium]